MLARDYTWFFLKEVREPGNVGEQKAKPKHEPCPKELLGDNALKVSLTPVLKISNYLREQALV